VHAGVSRHARPSSSDACVCARARAYVSPLPTKKYRIRSARIPPVKCFFTKGVGFRRKSRRTHAFPCYGFQAYVICVFDAVKPGCTHLLRIPAAPRAPRATAARRPASSRRRMLQGGRCMQICQGGCTVTIAKHASMGQGLHRYRNSRDSTLRDHATDESASRAPSRRNFCRDSVRISSRGLAPRTLQRCNLSD